MGNGQSRDGFADVLPNASATKASAEASKDRQAISEAWTASRPNIKQDAALADDAPIDKIVPLIVQITPPSHALLHEDTFTRRSYDASGAVEDRFSIPESVRKSRTMDAFVDVCSEIIPDFLYVSNFQVARDRTKLKALGISHVVNCCGELKVYDDASPHTLREVSEMTDCHVLKLLLRDDANEDLTPFLPQVLDYIASCRQRGEKVLVHCHQGISRSCAFAIAYVMLEQQLSYQEAAGLVRSRRAISSPNAAFICQLLEWEKDLQAVSDNGCELYRLAPHSSYDPDTLVLKRCYDPALGSARQRQNLVNVRTHEDQQHFLWTRGTFVFRSPDDPSKVTIWQGSNCEIPEAVPIAEKLAMLLIRTQALARQTDMPEITFTSIQAIKQQGTDVDHFGYATELTWKRTFVPKMPSEQAVEGALKPNGSADCSDPGDGSTSGGKLPQLFLLETSDEENEFSWDQLTNYDSEDLSSGSAFLLISGQERHVEGYVWMGESCKISLDRVVREADTQIQRVFHSNETTTFKPLQIERQSQESDAFWQLFEAGY